MVKKRLGDENAMMENFGGVATFVATKELRADGPPILFRLYQCAGHNASKCIIWGAARATSAAPAFCKPIKIEVPRPGERFGGGELAHNNPAELALSEVPKIWSHSKRCCIVSIGAGRQRAVKVVNIPHSSSKIKNNFTHSIQKRVSLLIPGVIKLSRISSDLSALQNIVEACIQPITNSEFLHQRILTSLEGINPEALRYHRFIVDQEMQHVGLEEWMEEMTTHTAAYMEERRTDQKKQVCWRSNWLYVQHHRKCR